MQLNEIKHLAVEAVLSRLLPLYDEVTLGAIRSLRPAEYPLAALCAGLGALLASAMLYGVGIWLRALPKKVSTEAQQARVENMRAAALEWLPWLLVLSPTPVGGILIIAAGFFALKPWKAALAIVLAEGLWRAAPLF